MKMKPALVVVLSCVVLSFGCAKSSTPSDPGPQPTATASGVYVSAVIANRPDTTNKTMPYIMLQHGNLHGTVITDATVSINSTALSFDAASNSYTSSTLPFIAAGSTASLSINSTAGNLTGSVVMPPYITVTAPNQGISVSQSMTWLYVTVTASVDPGWFDIVSDHQPSYMYIIAGGSGDLRLLSFSPGVAGMGNDIVTIKGSNSGTFTGAATGSYLYGEDRGGQLSIYVY